ncbi:MAG TPA: GDP-mannose 4,6-dehydratase [Solirubrobacteraceae bacterium]|nr:GDP-mannose 4,6-dehydratase [Solirubrobacteraceae bacterium]
MTGRRALITGIAGQDGSYLAELLLEQGYEVVGLIRPGRADLGHVEPLRDCLAVLEGDLLEPDTVHSAIAEAMPDELYHLAAPSFIPESWRAPAQTITAIAAGTADLLESVRELTPTTRVYIAASGEIFGDTGTSPLDEDSPCRPRSPYGVAKLAAHHLAGTARERHGLHVSSGITFNHESPRRPERFVSRKVTRAAAGIALGSCDELVLGNIDAVRDWSHARDVMHGAWLMLQQEQAGDYVLASGRAHTVGDLVRCAFAVAGVPEEGRVRVDPQFVRPPEATPPVGDPSRARERLGWRAKTTFEELIEEMVSADLRELGGG